MNRAIVLSIVNSLGLCLLVGCGGQPTGDILSTVRAGGELTYRGDPLEYHQVLFYSDAVGRPAGGLSDESGSFVLGTNKEGDGAPPGTYKVAVIYVGPPSTDPNEGIMEFTPPPHPKVKIPPKYHRPETSGLTVVVPDGGDTALKIDLN